MTGRVELLQHATLFSELCGLERRVARGGRDSVDHAQHGGAHDDVANAVAGVCVLVAGPGRSKGDLWAALAA